MSAPLEDAVLLSRFRTGTLPENAFPHREHVRVAWLILRELPPDRALASFSSGLRRYAAARGKAGLYHETITWAYLLLIRERMAREGPESRFEGFAEANGDLLVWKPSILEEYYRAETLGSDLARRVFLLPDRLEGRPRA